MSAVMPDNQNAHGLSDYPKKKMVWETMQVDTPKIVLPNCERLWSCSRLSHEVSQLYVEFIREICGGDFFIVRHDLVDIRINLRMKDQPHHLRRRRSICSSSSLSEIYDAAPASSSASRRNASAVPSSSS